jgi:hypothetical protein
MSEQPERLPLSEQSDIEPDLSGTWTITVPGGEALWGNVLMVLANGVPADSAVNEGPSWRIYQRMRSAEAVWQEGTRK